MTGFFVRAQHEGQWQSVEIEALTDEELQAFLAGRSASELARWVVGLAGWIRDHVQEEAP